MTLTGLGISTVSILLTHDIRQAVTIRITFLGAFLIFAKIRAEARLGNSGYVANDLYPDMFITVSGCKICM